MTQYLTGAGTFPLDMIYLSPNSLRTRTFVLRGQGPGRLSVGESEKAIESIRLDFKSMGTSISLERYKSMMDWIELYYTL